jgi:hypothetical protein
MKNKITYLIFGVFFLLSFSGCQKPQGKQDFYTSCLNISMMDNINKGISVESSADKSMETCQPLFKGYINDLGSSTSLKLGKKPSANYALFPEDKLKKIKENLISNYGGKK